MHMHWCSCVCADYSCSYWKRGVPRQGWLYLSANYCAFYAFFVGQETRLLVKWIDVIVCLLLVVFS